ncbi:TRAP-type C4-dicarboxylate transport system, periplasmic component [Candidatus Burkholderia pumila]|uniref:TRAP-type C4-dicarboxylate transport system, periplasmic component n=1 Tax=Candidatus Burkholderia pumila TaxID=1090375 RepID=A0ABR5HPM3_9BURK|nr:TRAP-type C4-dicarboxylate transport system, periplasmic component [Candidatus Burkholderia pumila]
MRHTLARLAAPAYRTALSHQGLVLLAAVRWPPTGIWSRKPIESLNDFAVMRIRTYDESSRRVIANLGAQVVSLPIQEALAQIKIGNIDAIISSGDGNAGRAYAAILPNFTALRYASTHCRLSSPASASWTACRWRNALQFFTQTPKQNVSRGNGFLSVCA